MPSYRSEKFEGSDKYLLLIVLLHFFYSKVKVKFSRYRPDVAQRVGRRVALLFHDRGTRRR
jgi:hypothetical protein